MADSIGMEAGAEKSIGWFFLRMIASPLGNTFDVIASNFIEIHG